MTWVGQPTRFKARVVGLLCVVAGLACIAFGLHDPGFPRPGDLARITGQVDSAWSERYSAEVRLVGDDRRFFYGSHSAEMAPVESALLVARSLRRPVTLWVDLDHPSGPPDGPKSNLEAYAVWIDGRAVRSYEEVVAQQRAGYRSLVWLGLCFLAGAVVMEWCARRAKR